MSHHIGDLENLETLTSFEQGIEHFKRIFNIEPAYIAYDLHPDYLSTKYALSVSSVPKIGIQHHHAHIASCMCDNGVNEEVIGISFDGTGYGTDEQLWGGEFWVCDSGGFARVAHLEYVPLPGRKGHQGTLADGSIPS
jgi:hydrogenase maturation protein HypF